MAVLNHVLLLIDLVAWIASANYHNNYAYRSPSLNHPELSVSIMRLVKRHEPEATFTPDQLHFTHGVASGDPYRDSIVLWTRVAPTSSNSESTIAVTGVAPMYDHSNSKYVMVSKAPICVDYKVNDERTQELMDSGTVWTSSDVDFTIKVIAKGLKPFTSYTYVFTICNSEKSSPVGRTKTAPRTGQNLTQNVNLTVFSCANFPFGFFNAYGNSARKNNTDYVLHLGDYIYEYENGYYGWGDAIGRIHSPDKDITTLWDYRTRYAQYRTDPDLQLSHQNSAWITVWDDHEVSDNSWKDGMARMNNTENSFVEHGGISVHQRKMNAVRAYFEWMPIRQVDMDDGLRIWRTFGIGSLFDLIMIDTRQYDRDITDLYYNSAYIKSIRHESSRSLMGHRQEAWFQDKLKKSEAKWRIIGNQVLFSRLENKLNIYPEESEIFMHDSWEGYLAHKNRTLQTLYDNKIGNNIFLAGDSHSAWVSDIVWLGDKSYDPTTGEGAIGVEFAGTAVTSPSMIGENVTMLEAKAASYGVVSQSTAIQWQDYYYRGYFELDISYEKIKAKFFGLPDIKTRNDKEIMLAEFEVLDGENHLRRNPGVAVGPINGGVLKGGEGAGSVKIMIDELAAKGSDKEAASEMMGKLKALATGEPEKESKSDPIKAAIEMLNGATLFAMESIKTVMNKVLPADT